MTYSALLKRLLNVNQQGGIKLGLNNCLRLDALLNNPSQAFSSIHVAGTNGKGSVVTKIAAALQADGKRVGLYTSPHISSFRERIKINGQMISEESVQKHLSLLFKLIDSHQIPATFFELTTMLAFKYFAENGIDIAVLEVGLGGRLDATNIVNPLLSVITSISLEHTEILGNTLEEITLEKAGIIKPFAPVVIGPRVPKRVIDKIAKERLSPCIHVDGIFADFHMENHAIAKKALEAINVNSNAIEAGLKAAPPCRLEIFNAVQLDALFTPPPKAIILDVAHNPDGISHLLKAIKSRFPKDKIRVVLGLSKNKDLTGCLSLLKSAATHFHLVETNNGRGARKEDLQSLLRQLGVDQSAISCAETVAAAIHQAAKLAGGCNEIILICGTFFIMGAARKTLGIQEAEDPEDLNERLSSSTYIPGTSIQPMR
jgi:dihydrofolate synthase / folylpolyglutamate synthase